MKFFLKLLKPPTMREVLEASLYRHERKALEACEGLDYAQAIFNYHSQRVVDLKERLASHEGEQP